MADRERPDQGANWERIDSILDVVLALPEEERNDALERECEGDRELLDRVRRLIVADREAGSFLEDVVRDGARSALEESAQATGIGGSLANARTTPLPGAKLDGADGIREAGLPETRTLPAGGRAESAEREPISLKRPFEGVESVPPEIGKYRVTETIGRGGFGTVYRATDPQLDREVAIKVCHSNDSPTRQRFLKEARSRRGSGSSSGSCSSGSGWCSPSAVCTIGNGSPQ